MTRQIGRHAVVVGAGMSGLMVGNVLANHFERVTLLERDRLPTGIGHRVGTPQDKHLHALLAGGQGALTELFPGFEQDLVAAGGVPIRVAGDMRVEQVGYDPFPQRDLGWTAYTMSRPLIEFLVRRYAEGRSNVTLRPGCRATELVTSNDGAVVTAVRCATADGAQETLPADLVVDASASGALTLALLRSIRLPLPETSTVGVGRFYATTVFQVPDDAPDDWKLVMTFSDPQENSRRGMLMPLEGNRWMLSTGDQDGGSPPADWAGVLEYLQGLRTLTIYNAVKTLQPLGEVRRHVFQESVWHHFERLETMPRGILPVGDAFCRFNPIYGQGMTLAAQEACLLGDLLMGAALSPEPLAELQQSFLGEVGSLIEGPWVMSAISDYIYPHTRGERPADFANSVKFGAALNRLAARDPAIHKLAVEVQHLLKPRSAYQDPDVMRRVMAEMVAA